MLVSGICPKKYWLRDWTNFPSRQARDICLLSKPAFFLGQIPLTSMVYFYNSTEYVVIIT